MVSFLSSMDTANSLPAFFEGTSTSTAMCCGATIPVGYTPLIAKPAPSADLACGVDTDVIGDEDNDVCVLLKAHT